MTTAQTIAQKIANQCFDGEDWSVMDIIVRTRHTRERNEQEELTKYIFEDGSSIIAGVAAWDIGHPDGCWCWEGSGHAPDCPLL